MNHFSLLDISIICLFLIATFGISIFFSRKKKNLKEYFQAGSTLPWFVSGTAMVATTFAADTPLAVTELVAKQGIAGNWLWWYASIGAIFTVFIFAPLWKRSKALTDIELVSIRYSGKSSDFLRFGKGIYLGFFMNVIILAWVNLAMLKITEIIFPDWNAKLIVSILFFMAFLYTISLGLSGISYIDVFQFFFAMTGCVILAWFCLDLPAIGGIEGLKAKVKPEIFHLLPSFDSKDSPLEWKSFLVMVLVLWWASWYPGAEPGGGGYIAQRIMATKDDTSAVKSALWFTVAHYFVRPIPWIIIALVSIVLYPNLSDADKGKGFIMVLNEAIPNGTKGLLVASFMAAYMSTIATHLNWGSSYLIHDCYKPYMNPNKTDAHYLSVSLFVQLVFLLTSLLICFYAMNTVSGAWSFILESSSGVGFALIMRWFWWRINALSELAGFFGAPIFYSIGKFLLDLEFASGILFTVSCTISIVILISFFSRNTDFEKLKEFYKRVQPPGFLWTKWAIMHNVPLNQKSEYFKYSWIRISSGIILIFSGLFTLSNLVFREYEFLPITLLLFIVSVFLTYKFFPKNN